MTHDSGQTVTGRQHEVQEYVDAVREALSDLPPAERDNLLEDLPAHLTEVAAEDPSPLVERLGPASAYAAELRATVDSSVTAGGPGWMARLRERWGRAKELLGRLDIRLGRLLGYERFADFARLLVPAWWVVRGYLAAMLVVWLIGHDSTVGLLPRLGDSTLAGIVILAGFVAGSIWLAHRTPRWGRWQRRALLVSSGLLVLFGVVAVLDVDEDQRWGWSTPSYVVSDDPMPYVQDVFVVDQDGQVLTDVLLVDQDGQPVDLGDGWCEDTLEYDPAYDRYVVRYPRCWVDDLPWWAQTAPSAAPTAGPTVTPTAEPTLTPSPGD